MATLRLNHTSLHRMKVHAMRSYPEECCGIILGKDTGILKTVCDVFEMGNRKEEAREQRYLITADDYRVAEERANKEGVEVLGLYHSHPNHPAAPSQFDLDHAMPMWSYLIVSVEESIPARVRSWVLLEDRSAFSEEVLELVDGEIVHPCA